MIFCEACDWKLNMSYAKNGDAKYLINSRMFAIGSVILGIISIVLVLVDIAAGAAVLGAFGMFLGGYTQSFVRVVGVKDDKRTIFLCIAIAGLLLSVVGFILGFAKLTSVI